MRLKDADALSRALCEFVHEKDDCVPCPNQTTSCLWSKVRICDFNKIINNQPTIEAVPVKHGHWIRNNIYHGDDVSGFVDPDWRCSECNKQAIVNEFYIYELTKYCPNCGAKMDK